MSLSTRILGVSLGTILLIAAVAIIVRMFGGRIPLLNSVGS